MKKHCSSSHYPARRWLVPAEAAEGRRSAVLLPLAVFPTPVSPGAMAAGTRGTVLDATQGGAGVVWLGNCSWWGWWAQPVNADGNPRSPPAAPEVPGPRPGQAWAAGQSRLEMLGPDGPRCCGVPKLGR
eukprot:5897777-Alexandrium_andersonii.AAC.1